MTERDFFSNAKVILVDDNQINLFILNKIFEQYGIEADCVPSGAVCLKKAAKKHYDLIFMDHMMPDMDGIETLNRLKEIPGFNTPVIVLTANYGEELEKMYKEAGFAEYMMKPAEPENVHEILVRYLCDNMEPFGQMVLDSSNETSAGSSDINSSEEARKYKLIKHGFTEITALTDSGMKIEEYENLLQIFVDESIEKMPDCDDFCKNSDLKNYAIIVHGLKNDAAMISDMELSAHAKDHEMKSKAGDEKFVKDDWPSLKEHWEHTVQKIQGYFNS